MSAPRPLVIVGGGEHARVVIEAARSCPSEWRIVGFADARPCDETVGLSVPRLGDDDAALELLRASEPPLLILGVGAFGNASLRETIAARYDAGGARWATIVHARACVSATARLGTGVFVGAGAVVGGGAFVGDHAVVNTGAIVEHDVKLGSFAQVGPGAVIGGAAVIGDGAHLGLGSRIRDHIAIGRRASVGMGAVVVKAVAEGVTVMGVPARSVEREP